MITLLNYKFIKDVDLTIKNLDLAELDGYQLMSPASLGSRKL